MGAEFVVVVLGVAGLLLLLHAATTSEKTNMTDPAMRCAATVIQRMYRRAPIVGQSRSPYWCPTFGSPRLVRARSAVSTSVAGYAEEGGELLDRRLLVVGVHSLGGLRDGSAIATHDVPTATRPR